MKLPIEQRGDDLIVRIKATPGARKNEIAGLHDGMLKVKVTAVAEKGKANLAIIQLLSRQLKIPKSNIELLSGQTTSQKSFRLVGFTVDELAAAIGIEVE